jgi:hypothetical protein
MNKKPNRWYAAIRDQLARAAAPQTTNQIWEGMATAGFQHASVMPRATLGARLAEMVANGSLNRVGPSTYRLSEDAVAEGVA